MGQPFVGLACVEVELVTGAVGTEKSSKVRGVKALVLEELVENVCRGVDVREETVWRSDFRILASDIGLDTWAARASDDCMGASKD